MKCGLPCEIFSRITGFYTATHQWNPSKQEEFKERKTYDMTHFSTTIPKHELKTAEELEAERISTGKEYWARMGDNVNCEDIGAQTRLQNEERIKITDIKISDKKGVRIDMGFMDNFIMKMIMGKLKDPKFLATNAYHIVALLDNFIDTEEEWEAIAKYIRDGIEAIIGGDIPLFDDADEIKALAKIIRWLHLKLEIIEQKLLEKSK